MMGAVQRRAEQRVHARRDTDVVNLAFALELRHLREQYAGLGYEEAAGLDPQRELRMRCLQRGERAAELRQHHALLTRTLRHTQASAEVDCVHVRKTARERGERVSDGLPVVDAEHAAARVGMQADDL